MRIYFLSARAAALKLNGAYLGIIDGFERFVDMDGGDRVLAEVVPDGEFNQVAFFIDANFFENPPAFADVYLSDGDAVIYLKRFEPRDKKLEVVAQTKFCGNLVTMFFNCGKLYLNCEGRECRLYELSPSFKGATFSEESVGGRPVLTVRGDGCLCVIGESGKRVFYNPAESYECGENLKICVNFNTCAGCKADCEFSYDGENMTLLSSSTRECVPPTEDNMHFAFFESVLTHGDFARYLSDDLKSAATDLPSFLGEFVDVTIPYSKFFERHGEIKAAGLVYPEKGNLFRVKYFAVEIDGGKICNVYEVE